MQQATKPLLRLSHFLKAGVWRIRVADLPPAQVAMVRLVRIFTLAVEGFRTHLCELRASALTFYTLLSIVPVAAMAFGIAKGFGFERVLERELYGRFAGHEEVVGRIIAFALSLLENTRGGVIAGIGLAVLFWSIIKVLGQIEATMNRVWGVEKARSFGRKFADYLSFMLISPLLVIASSSATVFVTAQVTQITAKIALLGMFERLIFLSLKLIPYGLIWILFSMLYIFMPNTRVRLGPGIFAGIVAGTAFQLLQWAYIAFQIGAARYNAVYGSFAALPLFLVWLQLSWYIVLLGAEISFSAQNAQAYEFEPDARRLSPAFRRLISLAICRLAVKRFASGEAPPTAAGIAGRLGLPLGLVTGLLRELVDSGLLSVIESGDKDAPAFQPARDIHSLSIAAVVESLDRRGTGTLPLADAALLEDLSGAMEDFAACAADSPANRLLKDL